MPNKNLTSQSKEHGVVAIVAHQGVRERAWQEGVQTDGGHEQCVFFCNSKFDSQASHSRSEVVDCGRARGRANVLGQTRNSHVTRPLSRARACVSLSLSLSLCREGQRTYSLITRSCCRLYNHMPALLLKRENPSRALSLLRSPLPYFHMLGISSVWCCVWCFVCGCVWVSCGVCELWVCYVFA